MQCPNLECIEAIEVTLGADGGAYVKSHEDGKGGVCPGSWMPTKKLERRR